MTAAARVASRFMYSLSARESMILQGIQEEWNKSKEPVIAELVTDGRGRKAVDSLVKQGLIEIVAAQQGRLGNLYFYVPRGAKVSPAVHERNRAHAEKSGDTYLVRPPRVA